MRSRSVLLLRGSCQVERIALILRTLSPVAESYDIHAFADYGQAVATPPADLMAACSVFVYQVRPFSALPLFGEELIARGRGIRLPFASCDAFWPSELQCEHDPRYPELPWGRYPYGDQILGRLIRANTDDEAVVEQYLQLDFAELYRLDRGIEKWFRLLEKLEAELSAITVIELEHGLYRAQTAEQAQTRRDYLDTVFAAIPVEPSPERWPAWRRRSTPKQDGRGALFRSRTC
jgi:hypothetical protein